MTGRTTRAELDRRLARDMTEDPALTAQVLRAAAQCGWLGFHARPARTREGWRTAVQGNAAAGYPDWTLVHTVVPVMILAEGKRYRSGGTAAERPTPAQQRWLDAAARLPSVYAACWTTLDWVEGRVTALLADPREVLRLATEQCELLAT